MVYSLGRLKAHVVLSNIRRFELNGRTGREWLRAV